ncbi:helix-turn-helix transcriptional regulator [Sphingobium lactosutens]|uniref:helix-turn-helix transcriptional regulator n=1 Tax=Sphingobium lactosutens TaxID=522773 RepID=UPI001268736F|nr:helix-turn-helix transcriptional regulator [Sphingobium lactosutens]
MEDNSLMHSSQISATPAPVASNLIMALGTPSFYYELRSALSGLFRADFCSAFLIGQSAAPQYLLSIGSGPVVDETTAKAAREYAAHYCHLDFNLKKAIPYCMKSDQAVIGRLDIPNILDPEFKSVYDRYNVIERISVYISHSNNITMLNFYRFDKNSCFERDQVECISAYGDVFASLISKHAEFEAAKIPRHPPVAHIVQKLLGTDMRLSPREAQICALIITGRNTKQIARIAGVSPETVITYRRRAYSKVGVADRNGMERFYDGIQP